jgi:hypothetical protein
MSTILIEAWIHPLSSLTPSLIVHNLELQGIQLPQPFAVTVDRGHYDCTDFNYAVITVLASSAATTTAATATTAATVPFSFCCSFFSQAAHRGMDPAAMHSHWLGNCYVHVGATEAQCSFRHEPGRAKTWRKAALHEETQETQETQEDAVSVDPICPKPKVAKSKDHGRIIQLQKKNLVLRTELDQLKSEFKDLKAEVVAMKESLGTVKEDQVALAAEHVALAQRHKEQEAGTNRANRCMQDWTNQQVIERVRILEVQQQTQQTQQTHQSQQSQQSQPSKRCKCKAQKKEIKRLAERLVLLENASTNANANAIIQAFNPFDFNTIYDPWEREDMPALDLIANHYALAPLDLVQSQYKNVVVEDVVVKDAVVEDAAHNVNNNVFEDADDDDEDDDDMFEVIQIFDFPQAK